MKKLNLSLLILGILLMLNISSYCQHITFTYDNAGNRITRGEIVLMGEPEEKNSATYKSTTFADSTLQHITQISDIKVTIAPNPTRGKFSVKLENLNESTLAQLYLHAANGVLIHQEKNMTLNTLVDIRSRENGIYILSIIINGEKRTWKVIKQ